MSFLSSNEDFFLLRYGACSAVKERMSYVASVLEEFSELDQQILTPQSRS